MQYNIRFFTNKGSVYSKNEDRILVQDRILSDGLGYIENQDFCFCFVADGIGGGVAGDFSAEYVLTEILKNLHAKTQCKEKIEEILLQINITLIDKLSQNYPKQLFGTTLTGIIISDKQFNVINVGDSQAWLYRNGLFIKIADDHVVNNTEENSPITNYFGISTDQLIIDFPGILREIKPSDIILLSSDGLFKSLEIRNIKAILSNSKSLNEKSEFILKRALEIGSNDNISCILIECV